MRVSIIGAGYVGLVSGACLAEKGHQVCCVDSDAGKVNTINQAIAPIYEAGLNDLLRRNIGSRLTATTDIEAAVLDSEITFIAVGSPFVNDAIDLSAVKQASAQIGAAIARKREYHTVVVKSTVIPGTTDSVVAPILEAASGKRRGRDFGAGMNPEFLSEGRAIQDFMHPDRIVIGGMDQGSIECQKRLFDVFPGTPTVVTNTRTAEMIKYASNCLLATAISYSNEIANLCAAVGGIDAIEVMRGVHLSRYLTSELPDGTRLQPLFVSYLEGGCGYGGSCLPKDTKALAAQGCASGIPMHLLSAVSRINDEQPMHLVRLMEKHFPLLAGVRTAVLGLAFKPGTDDVRESPAFPLIRELVRRGAEVKAYDPLAVANARQILDSGEVQFAGSLAEALENADAAIIVTRWEEFVRVPELLKSNPKPTVLIDGRRMIGRGSVQEYEAIGC
jgi:UDPglucose 6-dehydrogenase